MLTATLSSTPSNVGTLTNNQSSVYFGDDVYLYLENNWDNSQSGECITDNNTWSLIVNNSCPDKFIIGAVENIVDNCVGFIASTSGPQLTVQFRNCSYVNDSVVVGGVGGYDQVSFCATEIYSTGGANIQPNPNPLESCNGITTTSTTTEPPLICEGYSVYGDGSVDWYDCVTGNYQSSYAGAGLTVCTQGGVNVISGDVTITPMGSCFG
jgi:hypothetical protein